MGFKLRLQSWVFSLLIVRVFRAKRCHGSFVSSYSYKLILTFRAKIKEHFVTYDTIPEGTASLKILPMLSGFFLLCSDREVLIETNQRVKSKRSHNFPVAIASIVAKSYGSRPLRWHFWRNE